MPIDVKLTRGEISFRHPDSQRWVRGRRLGTVFTLEQLGIAPPVLKSNIRSNWQQISEIAR